MIYRAGVWGSCLSKPQWNSWRNNHSNEWQKGGISACHPARQHKQASHAAKLRERRSLNTDHRDGLKLVIIISYAHILNQQLWVNAWLKHHQNFFFKPELPSHLPVQTSPINVESLKCEVYCHTVQRQIIEMEFYIRKAVFVNVWMCVCVRS